MSKTQTNPLMEFFKSLNNKGLGFFPLLFFLSPSVLQGPQIRSSSAKIWGELSILRGSLKAMNTVIFHVPQCAFTEVSAHFNSSLSNGGCEDTRLPSDQDNMLVCLCVSCHSQWWANFRKVVTSKAGIKHQFAGHTALLVQLTWHVLGEFKSFFRSALKRDLRVQLVVDIFLSR